MLPNQPARAKRARKVLRHWVAMAALLAGTGPALVLTSTPARADVFGACEVWRGYGVRCIRGGNVDGVLVDMVPLDVRVSFRIQVWHSLCGLPGRRGPRQEVVLTRDDTERPRYRFNQGLSVVHRSGFNATCIEFFIEDCKAANGIEAPCAGVLDVTGLPAPYDRPAAQ